MKNLIVVEAILNFMLILFVSKGADSSAIGNGIHSSSGSNLIHKRNSLEQGTHALAIEKAELQ